MKATKILSIISSVGLLFCYSGVAQETLQLQFQAVCRTTNASGDIVRKVVSNSTLIRDCVREHSVTNHNRLRLYYHIGGDQNGDTIEVINRKNGDVACTKFKLLFQLQAVSNSDGSETVQLAKVFGEQQSEEIGTAVIHKSTNSRGRTRVDGTIQYFLREDDTHTTSICSGSFDTSSSRTPSIRLPQF